MSSALNLKLNLKLKLKGRSLCFPARRNVDVALQLAVDAQVDVAGFPLSNPYVGGEGTAFNFNFKFNFKLRVTDAEAETSLSGSSEVDAVHFVQRLLEPRFPQDGPKAAVSAYRIY